ncbi:hypothetical protein MHBO_000777 [Bonamia ostreae]|uniref:Uncharacterized protein n=1 Tax=Bonamia ostreae TaxID=126728 RepID=A0ABV2AGZ1_9EUKA
MKNWNSKRNANETQRILNLLQNWKERMNGREVLMLSGASGVGCFADIYKDKHLFKQMITCPVADDNLNFFSFAHWNYKNKICLAKFYSFFNFG